MRYFLLLLFLIPLCGNATVYTQTDSNGHTVYSDTPFQNSQPIDIPNSASTITTPTEKTQSQQTLSTSAISTKEIDTHQPYTLFTMTNPIDQQTFQNQREIPVEVSTKPDLQKGDKIQLYLDGQAYGDAATSTHLMMNQVERGSHTVSAAIVSESKTVLKQTPAITIFVLYAHLGTGSTGG